MRALMSVVASKSLKPAELEEGHEPENGRVDRSDSYVASEGGALKVINEYATGVSAQDDLTGLELDPRQVLEARMMEVDYINKKPVWIKIPRK